MCSCDPVIWVEQTDNVKMRDSKDALRVDYYADHDQDEEREEDKFRRDAVAIDQLRINSNIFNDWQRNMRLGEIMSARRARTSGEPQDAPVGYLDHKIRPVGTDLKIAKHMLAAPRRDLIDMRKYLRDIKATVLGKCFVSI